MSGLKEWDPSEDDERQKGPAGKRLREWECPSCNANNPTDEFVPEKKGIETRCNYCGVEFKVTLSEEGRFKFREQ